MGFWGIYWIRSTISDLAELMSMKKSNNMSELRKQIEILVIDDDEFPNERPLRNNGFHITHKRDIDTVKDVASYDVIMCDIRGVGKVLGSDKEGAFVIKEIRTNYPNKQIVAYTGSSYDAEYNKYLALADCVIAKGTALDDWVAILDEQISKAVDPRYQWGKIRNHLLADGISTIKVAQIEDRYVRAVKNQSVDSLNEYVKKIDNAKVQEILSEFLSSVCVKLLTGGK